LLNSGDSRDFDDWEGNIEGIDSNELLNKMISNGIFNKKKR
jgi:hypothetical protein